MVLTIKSKIKNVKYGTSWTPYDYNESHLSQIATEN